MVDTYGRAIIELLAHDVDPKEICTMMSLCDKVSIIGDLLFPTWVNFLGTVALNDAPSTKQNHPWEPELDS